MRVAATAAALVLLLTTLHAAQAWPTPGVNLGPRIVPEPHETNDFISHAEARAMLAELDAAYPDYVEVLELGPTFGWPNTLTGAHDTFQVFAVEVTHEASATPRDQKRVVLFQLSIHGNEKGGREGGLRVIEDLAAPRGWGEAHRAALDGLIVLFTFPNIDGWVHEEAPYRAHCPDYTAVQTPAGCVETQSFVRFNGNGQDVNRDWPTRGWYNTDGGREHAFSEPELRGIAAHLAQFEGRIASAADIHGMLTPADGGLRGASGAPFPLNFVVDSGANGERLHCAPSNPLGIECLRQGHFVLGLMGGGQADALLAHRLVRLSEHTREQLNAMAEQEFPYWTQAPRAGVAGGPWAAWGTGWDTIGYTDSGSTGRFIGDRLKVPGGTYELSYNHITFDNHYVPELNRMHVESVRTIVAAHLQDAMAPAGIALRPQGHVDWLPDPARVAGDGRLEEGPHLGAGDDDAWEEAHDARPAAFWEELGRYMQPGTLVRTSPALVAAADLHETLVIPGGAWDLVEAQPGGVEGLQRFLARGGRVVLTDGALRGLEALGLAAPGSVASEQAYLGYVDLHRDHPLAAGVTGLARQTYDGVALGYAMGEAPVWSVDIEALDGAEGAEVAGTSGEGRASLGRVAAGEGEVVFIGALLPSPSDAAYRPYGLASHAVSHTGYQLLFNALGVEAAEGPAAQGEGLQPAAQPRPTPWPSAAALAGLGAAALLARRTRP